jgi:peptide/nickel transport system permease protein
VVVFLLRRLGLLVAGLLVASLLVFGLTAVLPGDAAQSAAGLTGTPETVARLRAELGLDRALPVRYLDWLGSVVRGDLGTSPVSGASVAGELRAKLAVSGPLVLASTVLSVLVAVPLGALAALRRRRPDGVLLGVLSQLGIAVPTFWVGLLLVALFAVRWRVLPSQGFPVEGWTDPGRAVRSQVLPTVTLALAQGAVLFRYTRSATLDVLHQDYLRTARAKGLTRGQALRRHGLRNAAVPVVSVLGLQVATLVAGVVVIERVFALPGVGQMLVTDVAQRDLVKVQGTVLVVTVVVLVVGSAVDVVHRLLDPRLRGAS